MLQPRQVSLLLLVYTAFVVYGSLVPLDLRPMPLAEAWQRFAGIPFLQLGVGSRADWIANGVLYLPLGALLALRLRQARWPGAAAAPIAWLIGGTLAVAVEFAQLFFPPRTVSLNDLVAEAIGLVLGSMAGLWLYRRGAALEVPLQAGRAWLAAHGLAVYALLYVAYALFPFDLLVSADELQHKLASDRWGWWMAGEARRPLLVALLLGLEVVMATPLGAWLARRRRRDGPTAALALAAVLAGLALGLAMEGAQLLIASGTSQGASVLARAAGVAAGVLLWPHRGSWDAERVRAVVARYVLPLCLGYVVLLAAVNGWFVHPWQGAEAAAAKLERLRWLPFYYHYYTSEAQALVSLASVVLMYLPVGVITWARGGQPVVAAAVAALLAFAVEAVRLVQQGQRPDPTNVLIAAAAAAGVVAMLRWARHELPAAAAGAAAPTARRARVRAQGDVTSPAWLAVPLALLAWHLWSAAALAPIAVAVVLACAGAAWHRPTLALTLAPAMLPALDLAPWTGRQLWDEFDLLLAACLAVGFVRTLPARRRADGPWLLVFGVFVLSHASSTLRALVEGAELGAGFMGYHGPYNALRIAKGVMWAALFVVVARRIEATRGGAWAAFSTGMRAGLAWVVLFVLWERAAFVGLLDFATDYRTTGPFSAMHRGGAFVECYLAMATPFAAASLLEARRTWGRAAALALLAGAGYAMFVTYSRNGYGAMAVGVVVWLALWSRRVGAAVPWWRLALVPAAVAAAALPVFVGDYAQGRLATWQRDLGVRQTHWSEALAMRDEGLWTGVLGMGVGRYPQVHLWTVDDASRAATYRMGVDAGRPFLQLGGGALTYLDQFVHLPSHGDLTVSIELRASQPGAAIGVSVCEKWMLTSRRCAEATVGAGAKPDTWVRAEATLSLGVLRGETAGVRRSVKFALHSPTLGVVVDVRAVALRDADGRDLVANGDFTSGLDRWLFSTNEQQPYQIDSLPVTVLFDQGWLGVLAWSLLLATALARGVGQAWQGSGQAAVAVAALAAFLASGLLNTLIDEPRFLALLLAIGWWCCMAETVAPRMKDDRYGGQVAAATK